jgi:hypothetical protein
MRSISAPYAWRRISALTIGYAFGVARLEKSEVTFLSHHFNFRMRFSSNLPAPSNRTIIPLIPANPTYTDKAQPTSTSIIRERYLSTRGNFSACLEHHVLT